MSTKFNDSIGVGALSTPGQIDTIAGETTGAWTTTNGQSGTFAGAGFTSFQNQFKTIRNAAETFAAANITPVLGSQVAWT